MNKQLIAEVIVLVVVVAAAIIFWQINDVGDVEVTRQISAESAATSAEVVPDINPVGKTNPFSGIKTNPFE